MNNNNDNDYEMEMIAETDNFAVWRSEEDEGYLYHVELGSITLHLAAEEWEEFLVLIKSAA